jgi:BlaI family transcriptional regulator, penicillinase repressor
MPKAKSDVLTEAEQRIMRVMWAKGEASVRDVTEALEDSYPVAYNTVLTLLRILTDKGYVEPRQGEGRAFVYTPTVTQAEAQTRALRKLVGTFFEGSPTALAQHLVRKGDIGAGELEALMRELDDMDDKDAQKPATTSGKKAGK